MKIDHVFGYSSAADGSNKTVELEEYSLEDQVKFLNIYSSCDISIVVKNNISSSANFYSKIRNVENIKSLHINDRNFDVSFISSCPELLELSLNLNYIYPNLDLSKNGLLKKIHLKAPEKISGLEGCVNIEQFRVWSPSIFLMEQISNFRKILYLEYVRPKGSTFILPKYSCIRKLELYYIRNIKSIHLPDIVSECIEEFVMCHSSSVDDLFFASRPKNLRSFTLIGCGEVKLNTIILREQMLRYYIERSKIHY